MSADSTHESTVRSTHDKREPQRQTAGVMDAIIRHHEDLPRERLIQLIWLTAAAQGVYDHPPVQSNIDEVWSRVDEHRPLEQRWFR